jgi:hypothetical protein
MALVASYPALTFFLKRAIREEAYLPDATVPDYSLLTSIFCRVGSFSKPFTVCVPQADSAVAKVNITKILTE